MAPWLPEHLLALPLRENPWKDLPVDLPSPTLPQGHRTSGRGLAYALARPLLLEEVEKRIGVLLGEVPPESKEEAFLASLGESLRGGKEEASLVLEALRMLPEAERSYWALTLACRDQELFRTLLQCAKGEGLSLLDIVRFGELGV